MVFSYFSNSIALAFFSFIVGMAVYFFLRKTKFHNDKLLNLNFVKSDLLNKFLGVNFLKWIVRNTPVKYFNQKIKLKGIVDKSDLQKMRQEMTKSEIEHLVGFAFVTIFVLVKFYKSEWLFGLIMMMVNVFMNLNPSLLQQQNKRRLDDLIKKNEDKE
ncbi:MAG: hypothetical protein IPO64_13360 [Bacteroidetes bacterium]|nr:hypothetical protein [Bacteroidota bacterium]